jgi:phospholipid/cholesterol/gamma-HCH transport system substrate-binding protein
MAAAVFLSYAYRFQTTHTHYPFHLQAIFERVDGIVIGSDIKLRGIKVGQVSQLALNEKDLRAKLTLSFFNYYPFPEDSIVEVASEGLMGPSIFLLYQEIVRRH